MHVTPERYVDGVEPVPARRAGAEADTLSRAPESREERTGPRELLEVDGKVGWPAAQVRHRSLRIGAAFLTSIFGSGSAGTSSL